MRRAVRDEAAVDRGQDLMLFSTWYRLNSISKTKAYGLVKLKRVRLVREGRTPYITASARAAYVKLLEKEAAADTPA